MATPLPPLPAPWVHAGAVPLAALLDPGTVAPEDVLSAAVRFEEAARRLRLHSLLERLRSGWPTQAIPVTLKVQLLGHLSAFVPAAALSRPSDHDYAGANAINDWLHSEKGVFSVGDDSQASAMLQALFKERIISGPDDIPRLAQGLPAQDAALLRALSLAAAVPALSHEPASSRPRV